jgi:Histidine kinase-, DNA gyrase B-, and HSP90-like ATPase
MSTNDWEQIQPKVNAEAEFFEILNDFGNPLEILREAISNSIDAHSSFIRISFEVGEVGGSKRLILILEDDGDGMCKDVISRDFWGLGYSPSRDKTDAIGEKGHGTKIYLRSEKVIVQTQTSDAAFESICERPLSSLSQRQLHQPKFRAIDKFASTHGTKITIIGYNDNERSKFIQEWVRDYIVWFTKVGSIETIFGVEKLKHFKVFLKCLDKTEFEEINYGHIFPDENNDINELFQKRSTEAADWYVKRYIWQDCRLNKHPEVTYQVVVSVEGDEIKRDYNPMIRMKSRSDTGRYRVGDRYGIWLCKDFIPVARVNEWLTGFGTGSNAFVLLHGFINCQSLKLTANRGTIANTDPQILEELKTSVQDLINTVDADLRGQGIYTLRSWQEEEKTLKQETAEYSRRVKNLKNRKVARYNNRVFVEPQNESELFGLFTSIYALHPDLFEFEPLDYNTTEGIDVIARNKSTNRIVEGEHWYVELKYLMKCKFNHAFQHLRWIVCWDFDKSVAIGSEFQGVEETDIRRLAADTGEDGHIIYFLDNKRKATKIQIIKLKEFLRNKLGIEFKVETTNAT